MRDCFRRLAPSATFLLVVASIAGCGSSADTGFQGSGIATGGARAADGSTSVSGGTGGDSTMSSGAANTGASSGSGASTGTGGSTTSDGSTASGGSAALGGSSNGNADSGADVSTLPSDGAIAFGDGGATPGVISCAGTPCTIAGTPTNTCCIGGGGLYPTICSPTFPGCAVVAGYPIDCDDESDCSNGDVCCESTAALSPGAHCAADCGSNMYQLCRTDSECKDGTTCQTFQPLPEYKACQ